MTESEQKKIFEDWLRQHKALLGLWEGDKPVWIVISMLLFFALTYYAGGWEHNIYKRKKRALEILQKKLDNEE